jgi:Fe-only nitrogenase accessory protein AnfO
MKKQIAVFVNGFGETATLYEPGVVKVYEKNQGNWSLIKEKAINLEKSLGLKDFRIKMDEVIQFLEDCKIFVASSITGVPYFALEKAQTSIWEFDGKPVDFLEYILEKEEAEALLEAKDSGEKLNLEPQAIGDGKYELNLKAIQEGNTGVTSKQILIPFLRKGQFYQLDILCSHTPPWLEGELVRGNYNSQIEKMGVNLCKLTITKKTCNELCS